MSIEEINYRRFLISTYINRSVFEKEPMGNLSSEYKKQLLIALSERNELVHPDEELIEDWLRVDLNELIRLCNHGRAFDLNRVNVLNVNSPIENECHAVTALNWILNPELKIYTGFSDRTHYHSWLYDPETQIIYEPTPYKREHYFGFHYTQSIDFVIDEMEAVYRFYKSGKVDEETFMTFKSRMNRVINQVTSTS
mgnify:CR=1 FL=1